uniref:Rho termination factor-like N-terminal domain-containing protein n=1 Tax=Kalanchoe fedtschenkoi TaxID=63787 RepID=A0A7N0UIH9_KALFE
MSTAVLIITRTPPGYSPTNGKSVSRSGLSRRVAGSPFTSIGCYRSLSLNRAAPVRCAPKKAPICQASSSGQRRNPDFSRQNKQGFSRSRNRPNEERENFENLEESEPLSSKNGSLLSLSDTPKFQATASPGPREKEIVELFRKVQSQLRERAAVKEEKKIEALQGKGKENETVDSLLKLLRKHSVEQGKRRHSNSGSGDFVNHHSEPNGRPSGDRSANIFNSASPVKEEAKPHSASSSRRPASNFRKKSPVPHVKFQHVYTRPDAAASAPGIKTGSKIETHSDDLDLELEREFDPEPEPEMASLLSNMTILHEEDSCDDENSESEAEDENGDDEEEAADLSSLKLAELRTLAKARGLKGFSKLKKGELVELLSRDST